MARAQRREEKMEIKRGRGGEASNREQDTPKSPWSWSQLSPFLSFVMGWCEVLILVYIPKQVPVINGRKTVVCILFYSSLLWCASILDIWL